MHSHHGRLWSQIGLGIGSALLLVVIAGCTSTPMPTQPSQPTAATPIKVLAVESFLADIAQNVAGQRLTVEALIPVGVDPHSFELTPADVRKITDSQVLIINGAGLEAFLDKLLQSAARDRVVIEAAAGLQPRTPQPGEHVGEEHEGHEGDPHFWLDPVSVIKYVENIRDGLSRADPGGAQLYTAQADAYIAQLQELDRWITTQVQRVPEDRRLLVTNHESFGYFADRYGFKVVGAIIPSTSSAASPSAQEFARLADAIKELGVPAIFLETGANPQLAQQLARETGIRVVSGLYTHSLSEPHGPAPTYLEMMRYNTRLIVEALSQGQ
jgi:ABC-type Zn uptake system ZnuABC Zn-binding protein ZnuA